MDCRDLRDVIIIFAEEYTKYNLVLNKEKTKEDNVAFQSSITCGDEANQLIKDFGNFSNTAWIVKKIRYPKKLLFSKTWICHHSSFRKRPLSERNFNCDAKILIAIKGVNEKSPFSAEIHIGLNHSHPIENADCLRLLRVSEEMQEKYYSYFSDGLTAAVAKRFHENSLLLSETYLKDLANASKNPTLRQVQYLYRKWQEINVGSCIYPFQKLLEKSGLYAESGAFVRVQTDDTWAILVVTAIMKRTHSLPSSAEVDTTASCESTNSSLTVVLTATKAGALPIAAVIHENQSEECFIKTFTLLKESFPNCFGGKEYPAVFMTDDSSAEKNALARVWSTSVQLLCHFHVAQAEWRWLHGQKDIPPVNKRSLMKCFQAVMYATTEEELLVNFRKLQESAAVYPKYLERVQKYFLRREEWTLFDRQKHLIRGHCTNNFAEASIRVLKDVVLCRTKAFNVVALTDFIISVWEQFLKIKLLEHAHGRKKSQSLYISLCKKYDVPLDQCVQVSTTDYLLPSSSKPSVFYEINTEVGMCTCIRGKTGAFCKHQCFLFDKLKIPLPNAPVLNSSERYMFAFIATGDHCLPSTFYENRNEENPFMINFTENSVTNETSGVVHRQAYASVESKEELKQEFARLLEYPHTQLSVDRLLKAFKLQTECASIQSTIQFMSIAVHTKRSRERKIRVQPTSICRRRVHVPKGMTHRRDGMIKKPKRAHNLNLNINRNLQNAK